ncbi:MAG: isochorismate synthase [Candidatus Eisenbacteria bacterium]|uniref:isochorismate synthase n=1 Tax=Eiseniibacteriota bacterium TaxID=2212470 RepID=A0A948WDF6_UNCEI|nr:isochorismate synthase [Candidatus Eisenbacteria bacterium]MBU1947284.1 isochorismate synthase [Candidatus Eisenbacteria bacterium]MBU2691823.1 isochorismate synthase [Candidatus Eisenbacteria bacterium]
MNRESVKNGRWHLISRTESLDSESDPFEAFEKARLRGEPSFFWMHPSDGLWMVGEGVPRKELQPRPCIISTAAETHRHWMQNLRLDPAGRPGVGPVLFGAFRFRSDHPVGIPWTGLTPDPFIFCPLQMIKMNGAVSRIVTTAADGPLAEDLNVKDSDSPSTRSFSEPPAPRLIEAEGMSYGGWVEGVQRILGEVGKGRVEKTTLARYLHLRFSGSWNCAGILRRLSASYPDCRIFAIAEKGACFLGATPELLMEQKGGRIQSVCLAGSAPRSTDAGTDTEAGRALLGDRKERREHEIVVRWIAERLKGKTSSLSWDREPRLRRLRAVQHLQTVFEGAVAPGGHLLDLVSAIHPTPAVGGVPLNRALELSGDIEMFDRGLYAGPIGWIDGRGDGEVALGIRSALIRGEDVHLFAGAGIVKGSDPEREWREVSLKFAPLLGALQLPPDTVSGVGME